MNNLLYYEKKKILRRKSTIVTCWLLVLCITVLNFLFISDSSYYEADGATVSGIEAIRAQKAAQGELSGSLTQDRMKEALHQYQTVYNDPESYDDTTGNIRDDVYVQSILAYNDILGLLRGVYSPVGAYDPRVISKVTDEMVDGFYSARHAKVAEILNMNYSTGNYTQAEKAFVLAKDENVPAPFYYDYAKGWSVLLTRSFLMLFLLVGLAVCIIIAPIFAYEYQTGADAVVLSTKHGRNAVIRAKVWSGLLITSKIYLISVIINMGIILASFGIQGWNCDFQILSLTSFYGMKIWQVVLCGVVINYIVILSLMAFTMLLSAICKTAFAAVIISSLCTLVPMFLPTSKNSALINHLISLLPAKALDTYVVFSVYEVYSLGQLVVSLPVVILIAAIIVIVIALPVAHLRFCKHQVV